MFQNKTNVREIDSDGAIVLKKDNETLVTVVIMVIPIITMTLMVIMTTTNKDETSDNGEDNHCDIDNDKINDTIVQ